jgi:putrescine aminotransferase
LAKALGGGVMPIGCIMSTSKIWRALEPDPIIHCSTFGGNPLACTAASACINVLLDEELPARAARMGEYFLAKLQDLVKRYPKYLAEARGLGLLIGLQFQSKAYREKSQVELFHKGVLVAATLHAESIIRIEPPLTITELQINLMVDRLESILQSFDAEKNKVTMLERTGQRLAAN